MRRALAFAGLACCLASAAGCAAAKCTYHLVEAEAALKEADDHKAPEYAVYEYTMATRYLEKAREEAGFAEYKVGVQLARKSMAWSDRAIITVQRQGRDVETSEAQPASSEAQ